MAIQIRRINEMKSFMSSAGMLGATLFGLVLWYQFGDLMHIPSTSARCVFCTLCALSTLFFLSRCTESFSTGVKIYSFWIQISYVGTLDMKLARKSFIGVYAHQIRWDELHALKLFSWSSYSKITRTNYEVFWFENNTIEFTMNQIRLKGHWLSANVLSFYEGQLTFDVEATLEILVNILFR